MSRAYNSISELYTEVQECKLIDLIPHVVGVDQDLLLALKPAIEGLYLAGAIFPTFLKGQTYILSSAKSEIKISYNDILADIEGSRLLPPGDFYNEKRQLHLRRTGYIRLRSHLKTEPTVATAGCDAAIAVALKYLNSLCKHTHVPTRHYVLENLVLPEYQHLLEKETYESAFDNLVVELMEFVGKDTWNLYFYKIVGSTLLIEKGLDFRIVDWHLNRLKQSDGYDHDYGGVYDGYAEQSIHRSSSNRTH